MTKLLTYLINVTSDLLALSLILGVSFAFIDSFCGEKSRAVYRVLVLLGFLAAAVRAYITNTRRLVGGWRVGTYGYGAALVIFLLFAAAFAVFGRRFFRFAAKRAENDGSFPLFEAIPVVLAGLLACADLYCSLPTVYVYPFKFDTGGNGLLSTDYLFRLGGYIAGLAVCAAALCGAYVLVCTAVKKGCRKWVGAIFFVMNALFAVNHFARLAAVLTTRKIVDSVALFRFAAASNNAAHIYTFASFGLLLLLVAVLAVRKASVKEPYVTRAERRKQCALWRRGFRAAGVLAVCLIVGVLCVTWFMKLNTVIIREAPVEEPIIVKNGAGEDETLRVPLEAVADGHLHRFGYTTPDGNPVRLIVVLKQENTNNFGVGLDACEICGEAGYYENNEGQVVCKKCGVVMNRMTIGMKGGCNPIIIDYDIDDTFILVPVAELIKNQSHFKK